MSKPRRRIVLVRKAQFQLSNATLGTENDAYRRTLRILWRKKLYVTRDESIIFLLGGYCPHGQIFLSGDYFASLG